MTIETAAPRDDKRTPAWFFAQCQRRYGPFHIDAAANAANALCPVWFGEGGVAPDALACSWKRQWLADTSHEPATVWCNPPYGPAKTIPKWIAHARHQRDKYRTRILMLLPADTSTVWFQDVWHTELCELVPFRLAFEASDGSTKGNSAKFGSLLVWIAPKIVREK